jgi:hypothetical protein
MLHPDQLHQVADLQHRESVADASHRRRARIVRTARRERHRIQQRRNLRVPASRPARGPRRESRGLA